MRLPALGGFALQPCAGGGVNVFAAVEGGETAAQLLVEVGQLGGARGVVFLQEPESFADDFTRGIVATRSEIFPVPG